MGDEGLTGSYHHPCRIVWRPLRMPATLIRDDGQQYPFILTEKLIYANIDIKLIVYIFLGSRKIHARIDEK